MSQPYVGEIRLFAGNFAPAGWMTCDGQLLPISENETLFNLIGTTFGGDGQETFALPNLTGKAPVHMGSNGTSTYTLGETGGVTTVTLTTNQIPLHTHAPLAHSGAGDASSPSGNVFAASSLNQYVAGAANASAGSATYTSGGSQPHDNMQPYLAVTYIISLFGVFPSQT